MESVEQVGEGTDYVLNRAFWLNGQPLGFPVQFDLVLKHLRQDMRDDWYFDCLQYDDLFKSPSEANRIILSLLQEWNGVYKGTRSVVRNIPKKGYGERYGLEADFFDRFVIKRYVASSFRFYDPLLDHRVLSYRYEPSPVDSVDLLSPVRSRTVPMRRIQSRGVCLLVSFSRQVSSRASRTSLIVNRETVRSIGGRRGLCPSALVVTSSKEAGGTTERGGTSPASRRIACYGASAPPSRRCVSAHPGYAR